MAIPLNQLPSDLLYNGQLDVSNPIKQTKYNQLNSAWESQNQSSGSSGSSGGASLPPFSFDQAAAEKKAMAEVAPYYEKLLSIYNGDINMAKKRIEEDYARGLRYKAENTANATGDVAAQAAERERKFKLAMGDLDQEMNTRGLTNSGIKTTNIANATADEAYQSQMLKNTARDLATSEKQYIGEQDAAKKAFMEDKGFLPVTDVKGFYTEPQKKIMDLGKAAETETAANVANQFNKAQVYYQTATKPIATAAPQDWTTKLNDALKMQGLPTTG